MLGCFYYFMYTNKQNNLNIILTKFEIFELRDIAVHFSLIRHAVLPFEDYPSNELSFLTIKHLYSFHKCLYNRIDARVR